MRGILIFDSHIDTRRLLIEEAYDCSKLHSHYELDIPGMREGQEAALTAAGVGRIHRSGKLAAMVSLEGGQIIIDSPALPRNVYQCRAQAVAAGDRGVTDRRQR